MSRPIIRITMAAVLFVAASATASGRTAGAEPPEAPGVILRDEVGGFTTVVPEGWSVVAPGTRAREATPDDRALISLRKLDVGAPELLAAIAAQAGLDAPPTVVATRPGDGTDWQLYRIDGAGPDAAVLDVAVTTGGEPTYVAILRSRPAERRELYERVFLRAVDAMRGLEATERPSAERTDVELSIETTSPGVTLAGTLSLPSGESPHPAVLLLSGFGPQDRDADYAPVATIEPFSLIAEALLDAGIAVLRYDDRGVGGSSGDHRSATVSDQTADAGAAFDALRGRPEVDPDRLGILGHGDGAIHAASVAADGPGVRFVVGLAPVAASGAELLVEQNVDAARALGVDAVEIERVREASRGLYEAIRVGDTAAAERLSADFYTAVWDGADEAGRASLGDRAAFVSSQVVAQMPVFFSPWYRSFVEVEPADAWASVTAPILAVFGDRDTQVPAGRNELALRTAVARGDAELTTVTVSGANHLFQSASSGLVAEYAELDAAFAPDLLPTLVPWIAQAAATDG